jgi:hypothetical protein
MNGEQFAILDPRAGMVDHRSSPEAKIALFRAFFRGREDVYPRRFESRKTGKTGYQPACANEWIQGVCEKPRIKCTDCPHQRFLPASDETIRWHLSGHDSDGKDFVIGIYPMLQDETCFLLAADFDQGDWREDAQAFRKTCEHLNIPAALERSRSGDGAHIWIFFDRAIPAALARQLGSHILTEAMEHRPEIGFKSYDRFFPNQDTLPRGGFGNLIALPLQRQPRESGNSLFLDGSLIPYSDQWAFLSTIRRIDRPAIENIVREAEATDRIIGIQHALPEEDDQAPWTLPPSRRRKQAPIAGTLPASLELILSDEIYIAKDPLSPGLRNRLLRLAAFQNPEFYKAQAMRLPAYDKPRIIACAEEHPSLISLPRGCLADVQQLLRELKITAVVRDERFSGRPLAATFRGELRQEQQVAANAMLAHDTGVLSATTAFGKTVVASWLIAHRRVNTLVLVHRRQLLEQWIERLSAFLDLPEAAIGHIGGGRKKPNGMLDVALIQSMVRKGVVDDRIGEYGHLVVDECHHLPAYSFERVARRTKAKYVSGLSATVMRKDGHHPIIFMQCGPVRHRVDAREQAASRLFEHIALVRSTSFRPLRAADSDARTYFTDLCDELIIDEPRNRLICQDVIRAASEGRSPIVLTERNEHLDRLAELLTPAIQHLILLRGGMSRNNLRSVAEHLAAISKDEQRVLLATGRYVGEGFDDARLVMPGLMRCS